MNWIDFLLPALTVSVVFLVMQLLQRGTTAAVAPGPDGVFTLRLPRFYAILGYICGAILVIAVGGAVYAGGQGIWWAVLFLFLLFGGLGGACYLWYRNHRVSFDRDRLTVTDWRGRAETMTWEQITDVSYRPGWGYIHLRTRDHRTRLSHHLVGLQRFLAMLEERTEWRAEELRLPS